MKALLLLVLGVVLAACASSNRPLQLISGQGPVYPAEAKAQATEGWVVVAYDVDVGGSVVNARVVESNPAGIFDAAALTAVRSWRFNAPRIKGVVQSAPNRRSKVEFSLGGTDEYDNY